jgi:ligand-binding SRPBCC domain-containing protein
MSTVTIERQGFLSFRLTAAQLLPLPRPRVFAFFEDPHNLPALIPDWLGFRFAADGDVPAVAAGAEFDYTIRWLGVTLRWRSRITVY